MKSGRWVLLATCLFAAAAATAQTFAFKSIGDAPTIMYDSPSNRGIKRFIAPPGMPVEVVHVSGEWTKVRDLTGDMTWVETRALGAKRTVIVNVANAKIRSRTDDAAPLAFSADKGVVLEIAEPVASGWIKVKHRDGQAGFVRANEVWGV